MSLLLIFIDFVTLYTLMMYCTFLHAFYVKKIESLKGELPTPGFFEP